MIPSENSPNRRERARQEVRRNPCPTCGVGPGQRCRNGHGIEREANHKARKPPDPRVVYIESYFTRHAVPKIAGFVVYGIFDPTTQKFVYVGQTGDFTKRVKNHLRSGFKHVRNPPIRTWLFEQLQAGHDPIFTILETCRNEEWSLIAETKWVEKLAAEGHSLLNNWRVHKSIIRRGRR